MKMSVVGGNWSMGFWKEVEHLDQTRAVGPVERGHGEDVTGSLALANWGSRIILCLRALTCPPFPQWAVPRMKLERTGCCCWDHLDRICDWTQLKPLHKLLRFWWAELKDLLILRMPMTRFYVNFLSYYTYHLSVWSGLAFFYFSCPPCTGVSLWFYWGSSWGFKPIGHGEFNFDVVGSGDIEMLGKIE